MNAFTVDVGLIRKYNVPGPRYTSYPPATQFTDSISPQALQDYLHARQGSKRGLSLYFHLPFCRSLCWYCGCTTVITTDQKQSATYLDYLEKELALMARHIELEREVVQLHFGGGTPTFLLPAEIRALGRRIRETFRVGADVEAGVEIDPRRMTRAHVEALRDAGFNRASLGVQDHNPVVQRAVHRIQPIEQTRRVIEWTRELGFSSLNIDLIYGLPFQTPATFEKTLDEILEFQPDRLAVFSYAHVPWIKPAQRIFRDEVLPNAEAKLQMLKLTVEKLTGAGFVYIGMDHFAKAGDELAEAQRRKTLQRNFQGYSTRGGTDIYAFGMSAISDADGLYWQNWKDLPDYYAALDRDELPVSRGYILSADDRIRRETIHRLMCDLELNFEAMSERLALPFREYFSEELASMSDLEADGLIETDAAGLKVTTAGRLLIRNIAMRFDAYLPHLRERRFSKTI